MRIATTHLPAKMPMSLKDLYARYPLRPINDDVDLENAYEVMNRLAVLAKRTRDQEDYLEMLILTTEAYDKEDIEAAIKAAGKVSGLESLKYLMDNTKTTQAELAKLLGIGPSAASMILSGNRPITAEHARRLGKKFSIGAGIFI